MSFFPLMLDYLIQSFCCHRSQVEGFICQYTRLPMYIGYFIKLLTAGHDSRAT